MESSDEEPSQESQPDILQHVYLLSQSQNINLGAANMLL